MNILTDDTPNSSTDNQGQLDPDMGKIQHSQQLDDPSSEKQRKNAVTKDGYTFKESDVSTESAGIKCHNNWSSKCDTKE